MLQSKFLLSTCVSCVAVGMVGLSAHQAWAADAYTENPGTEDNGDFTIGPDYKVDSDRTDKGNPKGKSFEFSMPLADSKIFKGDDTTLEPDKKPVRMERKIFVYVPAAYKDGIRAPILVIHDGPGQLGAVRNALANLTISKDPNRTLPAFIAIAVENGATTAKTANAVSNTTPCPTAWPVSSTTKSCWRFSTTRTSRPPNLFGDFRQLILSRFDLLVRPPVQALEMVIDRQGRVVERHGLFVLKGFIGCITIHLGFE